MKKMTYKAIIFVCLLISCSNIVTAQISNEKNRKQSQSDSIEISIKYPFYEKSKRSSTGSLTVINGESLGAYPTSNLLEAFAGKIPSGAFITNSYAPGSVGVNASIRGMGISTMVDGMSTSITDLDPMEIESVSVLNGVSDRAALGSEARFNLILVNTKRGKAGVNKFNTSVEMGTKAVKYLPLWANGYDNANIYNQASLNDGLVPKYNADFLNALKTGENSLRYPNEDYYAKLFNDNASYRRVGVSYTGGSQNTQYFVYMGLLSEGKDLMKIQDRSLDRYRVRANLDTKISNIVSLSVDFVGRISNIKMPVNESNIFSVVSGYPSYAFPIVAKDDPTDYRYGRTMDFGINPIAEQMLLGNRQSSNQYAQNKIQLDFDLNSVTNGLTFSTGLNYSLSSNLTYQRKNGFTFKMLEPIYMKDIAGLDSLTYKSYGEDKVMLSTVNSSENIEQEFVTFAKLSYEKTIGKHNFDFNLVDFYRYYYPKDKALSVAKNDLTLTSHYDYNSKYYLEASLTYSRDNFLPEINRGRFFPSIGAGWILSDESFFKNISWVNYLKLRTNIGVIGSTGLSNYHLTQSRWVSPGSVTFGPASGTKSYQVVSQSQIGNPTLNWVKNTQFDAGIDASLFNNKLNIELNTYKYSVDGIIDSELASTIVGNFVKMVNIGKNEYSGVEFSIEHNGKISDFNYSIGLNVGYKTSKIIRDNNPTYANKWMNQVGNPVDGIYGYVAQGLFQSQSDIDNFDKQLLGNVRTGDIKYTDIDGNGIIEPLIDQKMIGNSSPSYIYGINLNLSYKNIGLFIQGAGIADVDVDVLNNTYFRPQLANKYSMYALQRFENGDFPSPSTATNSNNGVRSTYWLIDGSFFKIKNIELSYNLPESFVKAIGSTYIKCFLRGTNLLTVSKIRNLDPEALSAGVTDYPSMMNITGGLNISF
ncbi:MAG: SusC/RagA family TonB-linked outer membrane protein [Paludibacter sp.]|nr:SusC/RagA family TonB-linked outer membrane protein [Paludibacter sp.]